MATRMRPSERRQLIVQIATAQFAERGFRDLSLRQVAAACEMSTPGVMHYFPTLADLLVAVLQQRDDNDLAAVATRSGPYEDFAHQIRAVLTYYREHGDEVLLFAIVEGEAVDPGHPAHRFFANRTQRNADYIRDTLASEFVNADELSLLLSAAFEGLRWQWMMRATEGFDPTERMIRVWDIVQRLGVRRPDGSLGSAD